MSWKIRLYFKSFREIVRDGLRPIFCLRVEKVVEPAVTGMGYELVDVQASNGGRLLRLFIDKPGGVTLDDCAAISRHSNFKERGRSDGPCHSLVMARRSQANNVGVRRISPASQASAVTRRTW